MATGFEGFQLLTSANEPTDGLVNQSRSLVVGSFFIVDPSQDKLPEKETTVYKKYLQDEGFVQTGDPVFKLAKSLRNQYCFSIFNGVTPSPDQIITARQIYTLIKMTIAKHITDVLPNVRVTNLVRTDLRNDLYRDILLLFVTCRFIGTANNHVNLTKLYNPKGEQLAVVFSGGHSFNTYYSGTLSVNEQLYVRTPPYEKNKKLTTGTPDTFFRKNAKVSPISEIVKDWATELEVDAGNPLIKQIITTVVEQYYRPVYYGTCVRNQEKPAGLSMVVRN